MRKIKHQHKGITLIALVITIIVLLILAGVSIATLTGPNGLITRVNQAKEETEQAGIDELKQIAQLEAQTYINNYEYTTADNKKVPVPAGFAVMKEEGKNVADGIVITDSRGNEYVWIPCTNEQYKREEWKVETDDNSRASKDELTLVDATFSEIDIANGIDKTVTDEIIEQINEEKASVKKYGGYYIGRYEAGTENNEVIIKPNVETKTGLRWKNAYDLAKEMGGGTEAITYLCSSYAWDTAINFIQNSGTTNYATSRENFNENWADREVKDKKGNTIKSSGQAIRLKTGLTTAKSNIYDMGGNVTEFTTELIPNTSENVILRGADYTDYNVTAGFRGDLSGGRTDLALRFSRYFVFKVV